MLNKSSGMFPLPQEPEQSDYELVSSFSFSGFFLRLNPRRISTRPAANTPIIGRRMF